MKCESQMCPEHDREGRCTICAILSGKLGVRFVQYIEGGETVQQDYQQAVLHS